MLGERIVAVSLVQVRMDFSWEQTNVSMHAGAGILHVWKTGIKDANQILSSTVEEEKKTRGLVKMHACQCAAS